MAKKESAEKAVRDIRRKTRRRFSASGRDRAARTRAALRPDAIGPITDVESAAKKANPLLWEDAENVTNRTVKAPPKTGQNAAPGGISRPQLALRGTSLEH